MSQITIGALDVRVAPGTSYEVQAVGDYGRAYEDSMRADVRAHLRMFRVTTPILDSSEMVALRSALTGNPPLTVSGDMIGDASTFHATAIRVQPVTGSDWVVSFELHETAESILFVYSDWAFREVDGVLVMTDDLTTATHFLGYDPSAGELSINDTSVGITTRLKVVRGAARVFE